MPTTARKRTVFEPCSRHAPQFATETRYRRAEIMVEGGYANSPCSHDDSGDGCRMKPGRDFYTESFCAEFPVYRIGDDQR